MSVDLEPYAGRSVDLACLFGSFSEGPNEPSLMALIDPAGGFPGGGVVTGPQKLAQRLLVLLLTPRGSQRYRPDAGSDFVTDGARGLWRTPADVRLSFGGARSDVLSQLRAAEAAADPDDERIEELALGEVAIALGTVSVTLTMTTVAGDTATLVLPVPVVPR